MYMVGLAQTVVSAEDDALAPDYEPGARVVFHAPGGAAVEAAVAQTDSSHWCAALAALHSFIWQGRVRGF